MHCNCSKRLAPLLVALTLKIISIEHHLHNNAFQGVRPIDAADKEEHHEMIPRRAKGAGRRCNVPESTWIFAARQKQVQP